MLRGVDDGGLTNSNFEYHMGYTTASANANTAGSSLTGGGTAHNNMQPSFIGNWLIKT
jgi:microcystin-dependent protein